MADSDKRTVLVHLNVEVPADDQREAEDIAAAIMSAYEVGSDDESVYHLMPVVVMAEEV